MKTILAIFACFWCVAVSAEGMNYTAHVVLDLTFEKLQSGVYILLKEKTTAELFEMSLVEKENSSEEDIEAYFIANIDLEEYNSQSIIISVDTEKVRWIDTGFGSDNSLAYTGTKILEAVDPRGKVGDIAELIIDSEMMSIVYRDMYVQFGGDIIINQLGLGIEELENSRIQTQFKSLKCKAKNHLLKCVQEAAIHISIPPMTESEVHIDMGPVLNTVI